VHPEPRFRAEQQERTVPAYGLRVSQSYGPPTEATQAGSGTARGAQADSGPCAAA